MATSLGNGRWLIQDRTLALPANIRDASFFGAAFPCSAQSAREVLSGTAMTPVTVGGRAVSTLACIQYRDCDLGNYDEVGIQVLVRGPDGSPGLFTVELPVTEAFTLEAGREVWGMPKWLSQTSMTVTDRSAVVEVRDGGEMVLRAQLNAGAAKLPFPVTVPAPTWSTRADGASAGEVLKGVFKISMGGLRFRPGGACVALGRHRMSERAKLLGLERRALMTFGSPRLTGALGEPTAIDRRAP